MMLCLPVKNSQPEETQTSTPKECKLDSKRLPQNLLDDINFVNTDGKAEWNSNHQLNPRYSDIDENEASPIRHGRQYRGLFNSNDNRNRMKGSSSQEESSGQSSLEKSSACDKDSSDQLNPHEEFISETNKLEMIDNGTIKNNIEVMIPFDSETSLSTDSDEEEDEIQPEPQNFQLYAVLEHPDEDNSKSINVDNTPTFIHSNNNNSNFLENEINKLEQRADTPKHDYDDEDPILFYDDNDFDFETAPIQLQSKDNLDHILNSESGESETLETAEMFFFPKMMCSEKIETETLSYNNIAYRDRINTDDTKVSRDIMDNTIHSSQINATTSQANVTNSSCLDASKDQKVFLKESDDFKHECVKKRTNHILDAADEDLYGGVSTYSNDRVLLQLSSDKLVENRTKKKNSDVGSGMKIEEDDKDKEEPKPTKVTPQNKFNINQQKGLSGENRLKRNYKAVGMKEPEDKEDLKSHRTKSEIQISDINKPKGTYQNLKRHQNITKEKTNTPLEKSPASGRKRSEEEKASTTFEDNNSISTDISVPIHTPQENVKKTISDNKMNPIIEEEPQQKAAHQKIGGKRESPRESGLNPDTDVLSNDNLKNEVEILNNNELKNIQINSHDASPEKINNQVFQKGINKVFSPKSQSPPDEDVKKDKAESVSTPITPSGCHGVKVGYPYGFVKNQKKEVEEEKEKTEADVEKETKPVNKNSYTYNRKPNTPTASEKDKEEVIVIKEAKPVNQNAYPYNRRQSRPSPTAKDNDKEEVVAVKEAKPVNKNIYPNNRRQNPPTPRTSIIHVDKKEEAIPDSTPPPKRETPKKEPMINRNAYPYNRRPSTQSQQSANQDPAIENKQLQQEPITTPNQTPMSNSKSVTKNAYPYNRNKKNLEEKSEETKDDKLSSTVSQSQTSQSELKDEPITTPKNDLKLVNRNAYPYNRVNKTMAQAEKKEIEAQEIVEDKYNTPNKNTGENIAGKSVAPVSSANKKKSPYSIGKKLMIEIEDDLEDEDKLKEDVKEVTVKKSTYPYRSVGNTVKNNENTQKKADKQDKEGDEITKEKIKTPTKRPFDYNQNKPITSSVKKDETLQQKLEVEQKPEVEQKTLKKNNAYPYARKMPTLAKEESKIETKEETIPVLPEPQLPILIKHANGAYCNKFSKENENNAEKEEKSTQKHNFTQNDKKNTSISKDTEPSSKKEEESKNVIINNENMKKIVDKKQQYPNSHIKKIAVDPKNSDETPSKITDNEPPKAQNQKTLTDRNKLIQQMRDRQEPTKATDPLKFYMSYKSNKSISRKRPSISPRPIQSNKDITIKDERVNLINSARARRNSSKVHFIPHQVAGKGSPPDQGTPKNIAWPLEFPPPPPPKKVNPRDIIKSPKLLQEKYGKKQVKKVVDLEEIEDQEEDGKQYEHKGLEQEMREKSFENKSNSCKTVVTTLVDKNVKGSRSDRSYKMLKNKE